MEQSAWKKLLDELNLYIEEHYEGTRLLPFSDAVMGSATDVQDAPDICMPCSMPRLAEDDDCDAFHDIFHIFSDKKLKRHVEASVDDLDINDLLDSFEDTETFTEALLRMIKEKDLIEADVYNRVFMDRKLFNKIRNDRTYQPSKRTAILLSIALQLNVPETQEFLEKAGFSLTHTSKTDIIIEFFMTRGNYDVIEINAALYEHHLPPLNK